MRHHTKPRILAVDNDPMILFVLRLQLESQGYTVHTETSGSAALAFLQTTAQSHVVLLDVVMPDIDGIALLETIAREPSLTTRHRFALMTGAYPRLRAQADRLLARLEAPVILKPYDLDVLFDTVALLADQLAPVPAPRRAPGVTNHPATA